MSDQSNISDTERALFRAAMNGADIDDIDDIDDITDPTAIKKNPKTQQKTKQMNTLVHPRTISHPLKQVGPEDPLNFSRPGLEKLLKRQQNRRQLHITHRLDLHGLTQVEAKAALDDFMAYILKSKHRHVLIIHGKGQAHSDSPSRLKNKLNGWLREIPDVLAFCSAAPKHGGRGAVYVLLKSH